MMELYYRPGSAALSTHILLLELEIPHTLILVEGREAGLQPPGYRSLNPHGRVPTLVDGNLVLYEAAAIAMYLADLHPRARLSPAPSSPERPDWYRWMAYLTNTAQATYMIWIYPERFTDEESGVAAVKRRAERELGVIRDFLEASLEGREHVLSEYTTVDIYLMMLTRWGRNLPERWWDMPNLGRHYRAIKRRPAVAEAFATEQLDDAL